MPKHGWLTPKAIANRIKAKGLQKLRWYCQMCQKQCRDENGFKCHMMSESHQRQLLLVADNPGKYIYSFSQEFLHDFMELLSRQYGTRRVHCNEVYQQYIKDKNHFHMNATRWVTLTGFVQWLGRQGLCVVDQTPKGWFIKYIDRSPAAMARQAAAQKKERMDKSDEEITQKFIEQQIARALANKKDDDDDDDDDTVPYTELQRTDEEEKVVFRLSKEPQPTTSGTASGTKEPTREIADTTTSSASSDGEPESSMDLPEMQLETAVGGFTQKKKPPEKVQLVPNAFKSATATVPAKKKLSKQEGTRKRKLTTLEEIRMMEEERKEKRNRRDNWLAEGIVVKVLHKQLGERYYKKKGVVEEVRDLFTAVVRMMDSGDKIKIDQALLETVIPAIGKPVLVVNGAYRGLRAILETLDTDNFCVSVRIDQGPARDRLVERVPYEDISKLALDLDT